MRDECRDVLRAGDGEIKRAELGGAERRRDRERIGKNGKG
jgi:hypothetical protein